MKRFHLMVASAMLALAPATAAFAGQLLTSSVPVARLQELSCTAVNTGDATQTVGVELISNGTSIFGPSTCLLPKGFVCVQTFVPGADDAAFCRIAVSGDKRAIRGSNANVTTGVESPAR